MTYALASRLDHLGSRMEEIKQEQITYYRGSASVVISQASRVIAIDPEEVFPGVAVTRVDKLDWFINTIELILSGSATLPLHGDYLEDAAGKRWKIISVQGDNPPYEFTTSSRVRLRVHTEEMGLKD